jgi:SAM-dependent methyltransferase
MPTIRPSEDEPHQLRQVAESFGSDVERYDRTRPRYPDAMVERIIATGPGRDVLDVGCGTGIAARQFQAAGCDVLGIEPDARMAAWARERGLAVEVAKFEDWDPGGRVFDAVIAAQAWHWIDPISGAAKAARALRPGGRLAVFWNAFQPSSEVADAFSAVYRRVMPDSPLYRIGMSGPDGYARVCAKAADGMRQAGAFGEPERWQFGWDRPYSREEWLEQVPTFGGHSQVPSVTQQELLTGIGAAVDAMGGSFMMRYVAVVLTAARTA